MQLNVISITNSSSIKIIREFCNINLIDYYKSILDFQQDKFNYGGKVIKSPRLNCFMSNTVQDYWYSGQSHKAIPIDEKTNKFLRFFSTKYFYNGIVFNLYRDGNDSIAWHSDNEKQINQEIPIASLSFGGSRLFEYKCNDKIASIELNNGDLIFMQGKFQEECLHRINKDKIRNDERLNLTFRNYNW
ncbi:MAG: alpha-ketoglutarate-dependent dioxygenase AlkB [Flavobacterium sp.]|uniref:alpha-ketoglutarate-dependent dioxygenase AlkB n=1 Tax=Flavobacterium sp. TaxID=239 RepID=UPI0026399D70|nr:alpha-ketoglutarate-dependent dioxygenase AlkB [Flavobacterium sp.]MDD5151117.1 alpha-ketoglutarate-dependent dioxygenase AlkB [Flavobacterium sp.]